MDLSNGQLWMRNGPEWRSGAVACSLSQILETGPIAPRFFLSPKACAGILRRAVARKKRLPELLRAALEAVVGATTSTSPPDTTCNPAMPEVAYCLNAGGMGRQDAETETLIPVLDRTERGFHTTGFSHWKEDDRSGTLRSEPAGPHENLLVLARESEDEVAMTLRSGGDGGVSSSRGENLVVLLEARRPVPDPTSALRAHRGSGFRSDGSPVESVVVCMERAVAPLSPTLTAGPPFSRTGNAQVESEALVGEKVFAFDCKTAMVPTLSPEVSHTLRSMGHRDSHQNGGSHAAILVPDENTGEVRYRVRRLTVVECARLQGFPDDYLPSVPWRGKTPPPDGPMYKALGNSMAVPVIRWIGDRLERARTAADVDKNKTKRDILR